MVCVCKVFHSSFFEIFAIEDLRRCNFLHVYLRGMCARLYVFALYTHMRVHTDEGNNETYEINVLVFTFDAFRQWIFIIVVVVVVQALFWNTSLNRNVRTRKAHINLNAKPLTTTRTQRSHNEWLNDWMTMIWKLKKRKKIYYYASRISFRVCVYLFHFTLFWQAK